MHHRRSLPARGASCMMHRVSGFNIKHYGVLRALNEPSFSVTSMFFFFKRWYEGEMAYNAYGKEVYHNLVTPRVSWNILMFET
jgi:hypothetical protein